MNIIRANESHMDGINDLLMQVCLVHHVGRPDLFKYGAKKYTDDELKELLADDSRPVFAAVDENNKVLGYCFCIFQQFVDHNIMTDIKTLYIDDLCVDEKLRGQHIGKALYDYVVEFKGEESDSYINITGSDQYILANGSIKFNVVGSYKVTLSVVFEFDDINYEIVSSDNWYLYFNVFASLCS